mmetsp:Transcript_32270/g.74540  ORF Transcript_32270/g.74540 Transcript_32270/m.74540 type:complete len:212 (-) Transcript_32270:444-1079(-)
MVQSFIALAPEFDPLRPLQPGNERHVPALREDLVSSTSPAAQRLSRLDSWVWRPSGSRGVKRFVELPEGPPRLAKGLSQGVRAQLVGSSVLCGLVAEHQTDSDGAPWRDHALKSFSITGQLGDVVRGGVGRELRVPNRVLCSMAAIVPTAENKVGNAKEAQLGIAKCSLVQDLVRFAILERLQGSSGTCFAPVHAWAIVRAVLGMGPHLRD